MSTENKKPSEDDLADEIESIDNGRTKARQKVKCKYCGFKGVIEAHDTQKYPRDKIFKLLGKDREGYIHFKCPACETDINFSPFEFLVRL